MAGNLVNGGRSRTRSADDEALQAELKAAGPIPEHIAIIMDGNGRWAKERGLPRVRGHHEGAASVRAISEATAEMGVRLLTLYTFSTENWHRPATEVGALMQLLVRTLRKEVRTLHDNSIRLVAIGDLDKLPKAARKELDEVMRATADHTRMTISLALSYSGRWDLAQAARSIADDVARGDQDPASVTEELLASRLTTAGHPDPDLVIRTGGDLRISNFLLWESAYSELYFTESYWPDFRRQALYDAIRSFQARDRRFGRVHSP